ncbi:hypothetical protein ACI2UC_21865 [Ralstonia nicotianae]
MRYLVESGANWQGMSTYVSHGRSCFWFLMAEDGFDWDPFEPDDDESLGVQSHTREGSLCDTDAWQA